MRFQQALQVRLQERYRRLYKSDYGSFVANVRYFLAWTEEQTALNAMLFRIERAEPELDPDQWFTLIGDGGWSSVVWPETETGRARVVLRILRRLAKGELNASSVIHVFSAARNLNDGVRDFASQAVEPLIEYLQERLAAESDMLYLLERYRRRVLWFEQDRLYEDYKSDTRRGEAMYDRDLRRFLFDQGVDYPYSQPTGPSGKVDIVAEVDSDDPLTCEVKLFDNAQYGVSYLAKGLQQAVRYAEDYGKTEAHLVVFNLSERGLEWPNDEPEAGWPPRLDVSGVTVFLIAVHARPLPSASTGGAARPVVVARSMLVHD